MLVLLSPSKTQAFDAPAPVSAASLPVLLDESKLLMKELRKLSVQDIRGLMGISEKLARLNRERFRHFKTPLTAKNAKQAAYAFTGDVYDGFLAESLDEESLAFAQANIRILSGLWGVLKPLDLIQPYRLEMKIRLENPRGADLYAFWGDRIARVLARELEAHASRVIVNLASQEYVRAIPAEALNARVITPQFKEKKSGGYGMVALFAKRARGRMARYIAEQKIGHPEALHLFAEDGYRLSAVLSQPDSPVYTRG